MNPAAIPDYHPSLIFGFSLFFFSCLHYSMQELCSRCYVLGREFCVVSSSFGLFSCLARTDWWKPLRLCGWTPKFLLRDLSLGSSQLGTETVPLRLSMDAMRLARSLLTQNIIWLKDKNKVSHWPRLNAHSFPPSLPMCVHNPVRQIVFIAEETFSRNLVASGSVHNAGSETHVPSAYWTDVLCASGQPPAIQSTDYMFYLAGVCWKKHH